MSFSRILAENPPQSAILRLVFHLIRTKKSMISGRTTSYQRFLSTKKRPSTNVYMFVGGRFRLLRQRQGTPNFGKH